MIGMVVKIGEYYSGNGEVVRVTDLILMKSPVTNVFLDGVVYITATGLGHARYARTLLDFVENYKQLEIFADESVHS
jgi:hypothetical protein